MVVSEHTSVETLLTLGAILLTGLAADFVGKRTFLPRITLLMLVGVIVGKHVLNIIPASTVAQFPIVTDMALLVVGFLLGGQFNLKRLSKDSTALLWISGTAAVMTTIVVILVLLVTDLPLHIIVLFGCIAAATAPAPIVDVVLQQKHKTKFSKLLLRVVAVDDLWAMLLFTFGIASIGFFVNGDGFGHAIVQLVSEIGGALLLGFVVGYPASKLSGRIKPGQPTLLEALGLVFICGGLAIYLQVSFLLSVMVMGAVIANCASHHRYPFHEIEHIEWPFMMIFFVLAGASLELSSLHTVGMIGVLYIVARGIGKYVGAFIGAKVAKTSKIHQHWMGLALMPHAGVAIGMALIAAGKFPEYSQLFLTVVISATIVFELVGPALTSLAIDKVGDAKP